MFVYLYNGRPPLTNSTTKHSHYQRNATSSNYRTPLWNIDPGNPPKHRQNNGKKAGGAKHDKATGLTRRSNRQHYRCQDQQHRTQCYTGGESQSIPRKSKNNSTKPTKRGHRRETTNDGTNVKG